MLEECINIGSIPARVYRREDADALLLFGHGGGHGKDSPRFIELGRRYAAETGLAVVCIDAVDHGNRKPSGVGAGIPRRWHSTAMPVMVRDWQMTADHLSWIGPATAYVGFSMGSIFGIPSVAAMPSIRAAVFAVGGIPEGGGVDDPPLRSVLLEAAARLRIPAILMQNKLDDEIFPVEGTQALFEAMPGDKTLTWSAGSHDEWQPEMIKESIDFLRQHARA